MLALQRPQTRHQVPPHRGAVLLPPLRIDHAEHGAAACRAHRVAAKPVGGEGKGVGKVCQVGTQIVCGEGGGRGEGEGGPAGPCTWHPSPPRAHRVRTCPGSQGVQPPPPLPCPLPGSRIEVQPLGEAGRDLVRRDNGRQGQAIADTLGHGDDVGHEALSLEAPVVAAGAAETGLNLVGDADTARLTDDLREGERECVEGSAWR